MASPADAAPLFTRYQKVVIAMLAFLQFAVIIDFMLMAPLGALIMPALNATTAQFGSVVSAYAFAAGAAGFLAAGFADRFDRKKLLLFFYTGFILGTAWCGLADSFALLIASRVAMGASAAVTRVLVVAMIRDLFDGEAMARMMSLVFMVFMVVPVLAPSIGQLVLLFGPWRLIRAVLPAM